MMRRYYSFNNFYLSESLSTKNSIACIYVLLGPSEVEFYLYWYAVYTFFSWFVWFFNFLSSWVVVVNDLLQYFRCLPALTSAFT